MSGYAQYPPAAGMPGSTAIAFDSSCFVAWASSVSITRGFINISDTTATDLGSNRASYGLDIDATGIADNLVVSLGDSGYADLYFSIPIADGAGFDFAIFENSFSDTFFELAFVEVSSDGINFYRFPAFSLTDTLAQTGSFGNTNPEQVHNLAGKYRQYYGTPFDLSDIADSPLLRKDSVTVIRIVDVIGTIDPQFAQRDYEGRIINDPFPTAFASGGFDLDAVGAIHDRSNTSMSELQSTIQVFPNPVSSVLHWTGSDEVRIFSADGQTIFVGTANENSFDFSEMVPGLYFLKASNRATATKIVVNR
jgi:hypothetical protein